MEYKNNFFGGYHLIITEISIGLFFEAIKKSAQDCQIKEKDPPGGREGVEVALDLGDAVLQGQQPLPQESLKDRSHAWPAGRQSSLFGGRDIKE